MIATTTRKKEMAVLMASTILSAGISIAPFLGAEAQAVIPGGSILGLIDQSNVEQTTVQVLNQEACTNEANQMKAPAAKPDRLIDASTDNQVQEIGTQSAECGDVSQSAEINNSVVDESTTNGDSTSTNSVDKGDPIPDIG